MAFVVKRVAVFLDIKLDRNSLNGTFGHFALLGRARLMTKTIEAKHFLSNRAFYMYNLCIDI